MEKVVIIGGGPAGRVVVHALHASKKDFQVTLIKDEPVNVNRCAVPYGIMGKKPVDKFCIPNTLVTDFGAELVIDTVTAINTGASQVTTAAGKNFAYDHLVLATGSKPFIPPIENVGLENITSVRSRQDMVKLRSLAEEKKKCVIVGGGYIGVEVAVVLAQTGLDVTIVEMLPHILLATMDDDFAIAVEDHVRQKGIKVLTNTGVVAFKDNGGRVCGVRLDNGDELETDFAVVAVGVVPNTELAAQSGLEVSSYGIVTDDNMRTSVANIYAAGDCAQKKSFITHNPCRGEFGTNAVFMAKVVAANILGKDKKFPGVINANASSAFDLSFGSAGMIEKMAVKEGLDVVCGYSEVLNRYPMMDGAHTIHTRLVFERQTRKLIGGAVLRQGHCTANNVDFISFAIQMGTTIEDLLVYQYATHPELAAKPSDNTYMFAAKDALIKLST